MVAYSFNKRFVAPIRSGEKRQTIRSIGLRKHAMPGEKLQLYYGMRTKHCEKIADAICVSLHRVEISPRGLAIKLGTWLDHDERAAFAQADGFDSVDDMESYWLQTHGPALFHGVLIKWSEMTLANQTSPA